MVCLQLRNTPFNMVKRVLIRIAAQLHHIRQLHVLHRIKFSCDLTQSTKCLDIKPHNLPRHLSTNGLLQLHVYLCGVDR